MLTTAYNLDGELTVASGVDFTSISRNIYTRLPERVTGSGGSVTLRYDAFGRRLHKDGEQTAFYRNGITHPAADRTKDLSQGYEIHHTLTQRVGDDDIMHVFTPAGQTVQVRKASYTRIGCDHLCSVRTGVSATEIVVAHYGAYGDAIISGGLLLRAFAGYEPDLETGLYDASLRLYSPETRCFVSVDPRLQYVSPYPYCAEDPFNRIDPTGAISSAAISAIVSGLLLLAGVVVTILTAGAAAPAAVAEAGAAGAAQAIVEAPVEQGVVAAAIASHMPATVGGFMEFGVAMGAASSALGNGAGLIAKAAQGEHVSAWQTVRSMIVEPAIAGAAGAIGGAIAGPALATPGFSALSRFGMSALGTLAAGVVNGTANAAVNGQLSHAETWESIGIAMGVAVAEALLLTPILARVRPTYIYETHYPVEAAVQTNLKFADFPETKTPVSQWIRLRDVFSNPDPQIRQDLNDYEMTEGYLDSSGHTWRVLDPREDLRSARNYYAMRRSRVRNW